MQDMQITHNSQKHIMRKAKRKRILKERAIGR